MKIDPELKEIGSGLGRLMGLVGLQRLPLVTSYLDMAFDELARACLELWDAEEARRKGELVEEAEPS